MPAAEVDVREPALDAAAMQVRVGQLARPETDAVRRLLGPPFRTERAAVTAPSGCRTAATPREIWDANAEIVRQALAD
jgi:hypothetical protein